MRIVDMKSVMCRGGRRLLDVMNEFEEYCNKWQGFKSPIKQSAGSNKEGRGNA